MANKNSTRAPGVETPEQTIARLQAQLDSANAIINALAEEKKQASADEELICVKMSFGLSRDQSLAVIRSQRAHDAARLETAIKG
jgi:hypothetical protein